MNLSFKTYIKNPNILLEGLYGITHIEDLAIEPFIRMLKNLHKLHAVQKLDGANLLMGLDIDGKFYTSREQKGGQRFYKISDFPKRPSYDGFKSAHDALSKLKTEISSVMKPGSQISCEIIFGNQPNTVIYGKDNKSYVAFLEPVRGDNPTLELDYSLSKQLTKAIGNISITTNLSISNTIDGLTIVNAPTPITWGFVRSDVISEEDIKAINITEQISAIEKFLDKPSSGAHDFEVLSLINS